MPPTVRVPFADVCGLVQDLARRVGVPSSHGRLFAEGLLEADLRGVHTHGVLRLPAIIRAFASGEVNPRPVLRRICGFGALSLLDADNGLGIITGQLTMDAAIDLARSHGIGLVTARGSNHTGMLAVHSLRATRVGMIGYFINNTHPVMAPTGSTRPVLGNNPFSIGFPSEGPPVVVDMACSSAARGKVRRAAMLGDDIPEGWAIDANGHPTTNAGAAMAGSMLPFAGHKGYSLAVANEMMTAVLAGANVSGDIPKAYLAEGAASLEAMNSAHTAIAIDVSRFSGASDFQANLDHFRDVLSRGSTAGRVRLPGEKGSQVRESNLRLGLPITRESLLQLRGLASDFDVRYALAGID